VINLELILKKEKLKEFLEQLSKNYEIIAPVKEGELINFKSVKDFTKVVMTYQKSIKSPKEFLFPQCEELYKYKFSGKDVEIKPAEVEKKPKAIVGIHPCDAVAIKILDKLFGWDYKDELYFERRNNTLLISITCNTPDWSCFCTSVEGTPYDADGTDIHFTDTGETYYIEGKSEKGKQILQDNNNLFTEAKKEDKDKVEKIKKEIMEQVPVKFDIKKVTENMDCIFDSKLWDRISVKCIHCGACAYLCPTCHCFDINDEGNYEEGKRIRCWDACMFGHFTKMAGGHNPREDEKTRYRQRIFHKFNYYIKNFDTISCVGCGRCIAECPAGMDLVKTLQLIEKGAEHE